MPEATLRVVLDTNVLLVSVSSRSKYHWLFRALLEGEYELLLSNEILAEYEEIVAQKLSVETAKDLTRTLLLLPNVRPVDPFFKWNLISADPDDNKFVDCAVAANADVVVSHDQHFAVLRDAEFPKVHVVDVARFQEILERRRLADD